MVIIFTHLANYILGHIMNEMRTLMEAIAKINEEELPIGIGSGSGNGGYSNSLINQCDGSNAPTKQYL